MQRTIRLKLMPSITQADILAETSRQFTSAFNQAVQLGWDADVSNATKLHYLAYYAVKAEERGCTVVAVDPRHTSQACSCCGHTARNNRRSRGRFVCRKCGFELHADLNAARNIAAKYHASSGRAAAGGLPVNQPIVSSPIHSG